MKTKEQIIETNIKQKEFYNTKKTNFATKMWYSLREKTLKNIRRNIGILDESYDLHKKWFGDLSNKKVLDLGCFAGNSLSMHLAENSKQYIGIDLSDIAIAKLNERLVNIDSAKALAVDFLSDEFAEKDFDIIYAYGVLHHFPSVDVLINRLNEKLATNGVVISYDPLETSIPIKIIRTIYRPFQTDAAWEWPFTKKTFFKYQKAFNIEERRGLLGKSKWFFLLGMLPISEEKSIAIGKKWHKEDWEKSATSVSKLFSCMHVTMLMRKK
ncbi:class I SAM-dependent methyltransferase [Flavobacterium sp. SUN052]|uniref:class I SAM-dependent methyltransferase n=1 Tax=Flavobacterium sp. SUN052 TaxID=3002441 RepID=UPI00237DE040|nr:class I SAM-dependent methyltransferase [Flavobacterium sp. SUN052]MEC4004391.1 class I SAM-dependent methyltransferase [Flavobacterium sp. SUN052]